MTPLPRVVASAITILVGLTFQSTSAQVQEIPGSQGKQALDCINTDATGDTCHQVSANLALVPGNKGATGNVAYAADVARTRLTPVQFVSGMTPAGAKRQALCAGIMPSQKGS